MEDLYNYVNPLNKRHSPMISKETLEIVLENKDVSHFSHSFESLVNNFVLMQIFYFFFFYSA